METVCNCFHEEVSDVYRQDRTSGTFSVCPIPHLSALNTSKSLAETNFNSVHPLNICLTLACQWYPEPGTTGHLLASLAGCGPGQSHYRRHEFSSHNQQQHEFPQEMCCFYFGSPCRNKSKLSNNCQQSTAVSPQTFFYQIHMG